MAVINVAGYSERETQMVCNLMLPHEDDILNKFRIWNERHLQVRKPYQLPGWTKNSPYYNAPAWDRPPALHRFSMVRAPHLL